MAQIKIYGHRSFLESESASISAAIHRASVSALGMPSEKRFHRFLPLDTWQFIAPEDRSDRYLIIELMMFEGRPVETKKAYYAELLGNLQEDCDIRAHDIELTIVESPRHDWLIRGMPADEISLGYDVDHKAANKDA